MYEQHDDTGVTGSAKPAPAKALRAPWRRPSFRTLPVRDAEVGVDINVSDGGFTTS